ncbi:SH3 domain-containing protein [Ferrimonas sp. YFM]|uniref:SH3 domain-containing protein n=1 Tax=Ferrimonas sp. YFM TaxID=3028878 RepID=UPI002573599B|nr:SH3 domain-containing protein [Ferrimonas sp. YFM]
MKTVDKTVGTNSDIGRMIRHVESMTAPVNGLLKSRAFALAAMTAESVALTKAMQPINQLISPTLLAEVHRAARSTEFASSMFGRGVSMEWFKQNEALYKHAEAVAAVIAPIPDVTLAHALSNIGILHQRGLVWPQSEVIEEELGGITDLDEEEVNSFIDRLAEVQPVERLTDFYNRIPASVKVVLSLLWAYVMSLVSFGNLWDYVSPALELCLAIREDSTKSSREKVRSIKRRHLQVSMLLASELRFVTADDVPLFDEMSSRSEQVRELKTGVVVVLLEKRRNWANVKVMYEDGESEEGWMFSRYLERFKIDSSEDF